MYTVDRKGLVYLNGKLLRLSPSEEMLFATHVVARWTSLLSAASTKYGVPLAYLEAIVWSESGGNPNARHPEPSGTVGVGLMQITDPGLKGGRTDDQVADPATNIDIGTKFISNIVKAGNTDVIMVASCFNCGPTSNGLAKPAPTQNPAWGVCAYPGYLDRIASANNSFLLAQAPASSATSSSSSLAKPAGVALLLYGAWRLFS